MLSGMSANWTCRRWWPSWPKVSGPDHLGLCATALPHIKMALITSALAEDREELGTFRELHYQWLDWLQAPEQPVGAIALMLALPICAGMPYHASPPPPLPPPLKNHTHAHTQPPPAW